MVRHVINKYGARSFSGGGGKYLMIASDTKQTRLDGSL